MKAQPILLFILLASLACASSCNRRSAPSVEVTVTFRAAAGQPATATYVNAIAGGEQHHWYGLEAGETVAVELHPGSDAAGQLTVFYQIEHESPIRSWSGPEVPANASYKIDVVIDARGSVTERLCIAPCVLDEQTSEELAGSRR
jgi:hypothetical protein